MGESSSPDLARFRQMTGWILTCLARARQLLA
ncbi:hypothetical protein A2U01_0070494, partial [Trifolium medium]|nr:hypothetical protein [Trifolium medium]